MWGVESHWQLGNSADRTLFPKISCGLNFQLKTPNRSICISLHKYAFKKLGNNLRKRKWYFKYFDHIFSLGALEMFLDLLPFFKKNKLYIQKKKWKQGGRINFLLSYNITIAHLQVSLVQTFFYTNRSISLRYQISKVQGKCLFIVGNRRKCVFLVSYNCIKPLQHIELIIWRDGVSTHLQIYQYHCISLHF